MSVPMMTRLFEIVISLSVLLLFGWAIVLQWIWIKLGTPGPGLFSQQRLGVNARPFTFVKLRTMYTDARQRWPELYAYNYSSEDLKELFFKVEEDPRVTPQGRWLRRSSLDELPNFWNVLTGDMALVGPRPEIPEMLPYYTGDMRIKFAVRPGITGLAQISGRGRLNFQDTVELDCAYVRNRSFRNDVFIFFKTVQMIVVRDGAF
jgi:lipopolysaccharide/colanic/teichoic acid biosynthesis glycosyltransferase